MNNEKTGKRRAVLISLHKDDGEFRISLDDAEGQSQTETDWIKKEHITHKSFPEKTFSNMDFDEKELADFGYYVLARLSAFIEQGED